MPAEKQCACVKSQSNFGEQCPRKAKGSSKFCSLHMGGKCCKTFGSCASKKRGCCEPFLPKKKPCRSICNPCKKPCRSACSPCKKEKPCKRKRCCAATKTGRKCQSWAALGEDKCSRHAKNESCWSKRLPQVKQQDSGSASPLPSAPPLQPKTESNLLRDSATGPTIIR